jgi:hypothetical protein
MHSLKPRDLSTTFLLRLAPMVDCPVSGPGFFMSAIGSLMIGDLTTLPSVATNFFSACNPDSINTIAKRPATTRVAKPGKRGPEHGC